MPVLVCTQVLCPLVMCPLVMCMFVFQASLLHHQSHCQYIRNHFLATFQMKAYYFPRQGTNILLRATASGANGSKKYSLSP